ncbi:MAG: stage III sporulation protein AB [Clostridia bacterium]|nr:stage III sporulation protein AB [Clostridia bacterium]
MREIWIRTAGAVLLLAASIGFGAANIRAERNRLRELDALLRLVRDIRENIEHFSRPLGEIWARFDDPVLEAAGFLTLLRQAGMERAVRESPLTADVRTVLGPFASSLGRGYREEQIALCRYTEEKLSEIAQRLAESAPDRERLWRTLPVLAALSLILVSL